MPQEEIDRLLVQYGTGDRTVVRLKGGDPFVFGRGGEEALVLRAAGIPFEVVPGDHGGDRRAGVRGHPGHAPRARERRRVRHRARGRHARTGTRWPRSRGRSSSTWASRRCRGSPSGSWPAAGRRTSRSRWSSAARCRGRRPWSSTLADVASARGGHPRAGDHARGRRRRRCASRSRGSSRGRCSGAPSRSRARGRRRQRAGRAPARARRRRRRGAGDPDARARGVAAGRAVLRPAVRDVADRRRRSCSTTCATRATWPA